MTALSCCVATEGEQQAYCAGGLNDLSGGMAADIDGAVEVRAGPHQAVF